MIRYLPTYTEEERWAVLKSGDVKAVRDVIEAVELLYNQTTQVNVAYLKQMEREHDEAIRNLDEEDQSVLEQGIHSVLRYANELLYDFHTPKQFLIERAEDKDVIDALEPVLDWLREGQHYVDQWTVGGPKPTLVEYVDTWFQSYTFVLKKFLDDISHLTPTSIAFFESGIQAEKEKLEQYFDHFDHNVFGEWLLSIREERGWSLVNASRRLGLARETLNQLESGTNWSRSLLLLRKIASVYDVPLIQVMEKATMPSSELPGNLTEQSFLVNGEEPTRRQKQILRELFEAVLSDDLVKAHQALDTFAVRIHADEL